VCKPHRQIKKKEKAQEKVARLRPNTATKENEKKNMKERLNSTKLLDDLKEQESKLQL